MTLNNFAKRCGVHYKTAYSWWKKDMLKAFQISTGPIIVDIRDTDPIQDAFKEGETVNKYVPKLEKKKGEDTK